MSRQESRNSTGVRALLALALCGLSSVAACGDTPTEHEEHHEPEGVQLVMNGQVITSYDGEDQAWTGELVVAAGEQTDRIDVVFVDHDGDPIEIEDDAYLEVEVSEEAIATFELYTVGGFAGQLRGVSVGRTDAVFKLMHGEIGQGHPDFVTTPVAVHVGS